MNVCLFLLDRLIKEGVLPRKHTISFVERWSNSRQKGSSNELSTTNGVRHQRIFSTSHGSNELANGKW